MGWKFNPFTGALDQTGSGGGAQYIDGEVATYNDLPLDGTAPLNSAWLVREASGIWPVSRKQAGIYIRTATAGSSRDADYTYAGTMPDVFSDANFVLYDNGDSTKNLQFQLSGISTGTTRTLTVPDASGTLGWLQSVSSITVSTDHQLTAARNQRVRVNSTSSGSGASVYLPSTGNAEGDRLEVACVGLAAGTLSVRTGQYDFTVSTSMGLNEQRTFIYAAGSWTLGSVESHTHAGLGPTFASSAFQVTEPSGIVTNRLAFSLSGITAGATRTLTVPDNNGTIALTSNFAAPPAIGSTTPAAGSFTTLNATGTTELVNGTNAAGPFRIYNTSSSANANFERGKIAWESNVLRIGTEKGSAGGTARALEFQTDGVTRLTIGTTGESTFASGGAVVIANNTFSTSSSTGALRVIGGVGVGGAVQAAGVFRGYDLLLWNTASRIVWEGRAITLSSPASGVIEQSGTTTAQAYRLFNNVSGANFERANFRWASNEFIIDAEAGGTGTLRGIKIGSATSSLLGFYGVTPVDQPATVADPAGGGTVDAEARTAINAVIDRLQELGLIA